MTKDDALKMAIEALDSCDCAEGISGKYQFYNEKLIDPAINACKEALEQPAQDLFGYFKAEPFGWTDCGEDDEGAIALYEKPAQAETDKEKILNNLKNAIANDSIAISFQSMASYRKFLICYMNFWLKQGEKNANYTHPHQWQGLTDDEIQAIRIKTFDAVATNYEAYRAIEQALKEKNHG